MSEGIKGAEKGPKILRQYKRPKDKPGMEWVPVYENFWKQDERTGWMAVSTEPAPSPPETEGLLEKPPRKVGDITAEQLEKSRKKHFPTFIEESLPTGDKD